MKPGILNRLITIQTAVENGTDHSDITWSLAETIRASVTWVDGSRTLQDEELKDRKVARIICWDNNYSDNIKIGIDSEVLFPVRPIMKNPGTSNLIEITIFAAVKTSPLIELEV